MLNEIFGPCLCLVQCWMWRWGHIYVYSSVERDIESPSVSYPALNSTSRPHQRLVPCWAWYHCDLRYHSPSTWPYSVSRLFPSTAQCWMSVIANLLWKVKISYYTAMVTRFLCTHKCKWWRWKGDITNQWTPWIWEFSRANSERNNSCRFDLSV